MPSRALRTDVVNKEKFAMPTKGKKMKVKRKRKNLEGGVDLVEELAPNNEGENLQEVMLHNKDTTMSRKEKVVLAKLKRKKIKEEEPAADSFVVNEGSTLQNEGQQQKARKKNIATSKPKKAKKIKVQVSSDAETLLPNSDGVQSEGVASANQCCQLESPSGTFSILEQPKQVGGKRLKSKKNKKKGRSCLEHHDGTSEKIQDQSLDFGAAEAYEISSVDEDCSKGMRKWLAEYTESRPGLEKLQHKIDQFITAYDEQQEKEKKEREELAAKDGWTVVVHQKGRKKTTEASTGTSVGAVSQAAVLRKLANKKTKEVPLDVNRYQKREAQVNEILKLQDKFEQQKKKIQQKRAERKFRPY